MAKEITDKTPARAPARTAEKTKKYTQAEVDLMLKEAVQQAIAKAMEGGEVRKDVSKDNAKVTLLFQAEVSPENRIKFGPNGKFGSITGKTGTFRVKKDDFTGEFRDALVQSLLKSRELIVLDGLTDEERNLYGLNYRDGEYLEPAVFRRMLDMGQELIPVYRNLCPQYREMVAVKFAEAYETGDRRATRELAVALNEISKEQFEGLPEGDARRKGAFYSVIESMNRKDMGDNR